MKAIHSPITAGILLPSEGFLRALKNVNIIITEMMWIYTSAPPYSLMA
jgi:hypothetical protein